MWYHVILWFFLIKEFGVASPQSGENEEPGVEGLTSSSTQDGELQRGVDSDWDLESWKSSPTKTANQTL